MTLLAALRCGKELGLNHTDMDSNSASFTELAM